MSSTPRQHPAIQRLNRAYVQVPPSPLTLSSSRAPANSPHVAASSNLKENTPLRPSQTPMAHRTSSSTPLKRKLSGSGSVIFDGVVLPLKKSKLSPPDNGASTTKAEGTTNDLDSENLNGFVYCHQCNKKRDATATIICTVLNQSVMTSGKVKERICGYKYCKPCLKNRYNEDFDAARTQSEHSGFKCPRCRDICNCPRCRKSKGLQPIGIIGNPWAKGASDKQKSAEKPKEQSKSKPKEAEHAKMHDAPKTKPRVLPIINWRQVPTNLSQDEADERIFIREFLFRFGDYLDPIIAKTHLEELEILGGRARRNEDNDTKGWVSDACVKALLLGLLGLFAKDNEPDVGRVMKGAMKNVRSAGVNLNKIWAILASMRDDIANLCSSETFTSGSDSLTPEIPLTFPDPAAPPLSVIANARSLRGVRGTENLINVVQSSQMIPVFMSLIHSALGTPTIREELEQGLRDNRDVTRDAREATRIENERWEKERKAMETGSKDKGLKAENRAKREAHKEQMLNIENALKVVASSFAPRFMTLGNDKDGRIYYALSPGVAEREAALEYLAIASAEKLSKPKKKERVLTTDERQEMREWSWFVAIWGTRPFNPKGTAARPLRMDVDGTTDDESDDDDDASPRWWGFWDAEEISKLADWITITSGVESDEAALVDTSTTPSSSAIASSSKGKNRCSQPRMEQLKRLAREVREYGTLLQWRARDDKYTFVKRSPPTADEKA